MDYPVNPNPNPNCTYFGENNDLPEFELSDFLILDDSGGHGGSEEDSVSRSTIGSAAGAGGSVGLVGAGPGTRNMKRNNGVKRNRVDVGCRVAFRTKSDLEILDDGFKWRKYGKKKVKNSPNPRNYYRCSSGGCHVKKRVERDRDDPSYVVTTYEGVHNHESPCVIYYNQTPLLLNNGWTLQAASQSSNSS